VGPAWGLALAFGIFFIVQVPLSRLWLGRFEMGPMEYVWRLLSYGEASLRRSAVQRSEVVAARRASRGSPLPSDHM
jgi:uncharacterized membrane protein YeiB